jgi:hypothetical protein
MPGYVEWPSAIYPGLHNLGLWLSAAQAKNLFLQRINEDYCQHSARHSLAWPLLLSDQLAFSARAMTGGSTEQH